MLFINDEKQVYGIEPETGKVVFTHDLDDKITHFTLNEKENIIYVMGLENDTIEALKYSSVKQMAEEIGESSPDEKEIEGSPGKIEVSEQFVDIGGVRLPLRQNPGTAGLE